MRRCAGRRLAAAAGAGALAATLLSSCSSGNASLGHEACVDVSRSIAVYRQSERATDPARAAVEQHKALDLLRRALRPAALAGSSDGSWQALMTTLSESNRVSEAKLIPALTAQCSQTLSAG